MKLAVPGIVLLAGLVVVPAADAHVSVSSGPATASKSQKITFSVGHGCEGADTYRVRVLVPEGVTGVRALRSDFGKPSLETSGDVTTAVVWEKPLADLHDADVGYYELTMRARVGDLAFSQLLFTVEQTCRTAGGVETTVAWDQPPGAVDGNPAGVLTVVPSRQPGWNSYVVADGRSIAEADLPTYFGDAQIVWRGTSAYSPNAAIMALIAITPGVVPLTGALAAGDELWVKY